MYHLKNCSNLFVRFTFVIFAGFIIGALETPAVAKSGNFSVNPGTSETAAAVTVLDGGGAEWRAFAWKIQNGRQDELLTSQSATATTAPLTFHLPPVQQDTFVEMGLTTGTDSTSPMAFAWRTLDRPEGKHLADYTGQKSLLPPADFDEYWTRAVHQLDEVTSNPKITRVPDQDTSTGLLYRVELGSVESTTIVGWLYVPRAAYAGGDPGGAVVGQFPAIMLIPGYGGDQHPVDRTAQGLITFSLNPRNHGPSRAFWKSPVEHLVYNITSPENYFYKLAALDCLQGARFLFSRREVDPGRIGAEGSSQGGYLALATAALEPRIRCVAAMVIAFSDYPDGLELATHGGMTQLRDLLADENSSPTLIRKSLAYTDGANLATRVKASVLITVGALDPTAPYLCGIVTAARLPAKTTRQIQVDADARHEVTGRMRRWVAEWEQRWLKPESPPEAPLQ